MTPEPGRTPSSASQSGQQVPGVIDWRPSRSSAITWNVVAVAVAIVGLPLFSLPSMIRAGPAGVAFRIGLLDVLLVVVICALLIIVHEAIHGLVMLRFGARPLFGAILIGRVMPALYTTSEGHRFSRGQYLTVAAAPAIAISLLGFLACFGPWGGYLIVPLAFHFGGCVGDGFASWRVVRESAGTECEDLSDGIRFHRLDA